MSKILAVARREFIETVKNKIFLINLVLIPTLVLGGMALSVHFAKRSVVGPRETRTIVVEDRSGLLADDLREAFAKYNQHRPQQPIVLTVTGPTADAPTTGSEEVVARVRAGTVHGYAVIGKDAVEGSAKSFYYLKARNLADMETVSTVQQCIHEAIVAVRARRHNLSPKVLEEIRAWTSLEQIDVGEQARGGKRNEMVMVMVPFFFLFLMFTGVFAVNQQILTGVIEEKNSRIIEVILSAVSPFQLLAGKVLGAVGAGFILIGVWGGAAYSATLIKGLHPAVPASTLLYFALYFVFGFLMVASFLAALGSMCNTMKEAQSMMTPAMIIFVIPMVAWFHISQQPNGLFAVILSFIPPITPMVMILRIAAWPELSLWQIAASFVLLAVSVPATLWVAARIFRVGILMYGKPPSPREIFRWVRHA
ncbi:MAG: ABC transporter permease [Candidatus Sumerlaeia bacterium]|nr:ABC transporter permease [Candidatus Sumerlaeia bacterium]